MEMWCFYRNRINAGLPIRRWDALPSVILFCCSSQVSVDRQGFVSDFQQFTASSTGMTSRDLCSTGAVWTAARLKTAVQRMGLCMTDRTSDPPQSDKKPGRQTYVHERTHTHIHTENPGACGATWPDELMAPILNDHCLRCWQLQGETNQHPQGCTAQTAKALTF